MPPFGNGYIHGANRVLYADNLTPSGTVPLRYRVLISQTGVTAPVIDTELVNEIGVVVWTYVSVGIYKATLAGAFPTARTFCFAPGLNISDTDPNFNFMFLQSFEDDNSVVLYNIDASGAFVDVFRLCALAIDVYPV